MYNIYKPFVILNDISMYDNELWLPIFDPEYILKPYYYISNYGRIYSTSRGNGSLRKLILDEHGYYRVQLRLYDGTARYFPVHRLVLYTFNYIPGCENLQCNHKDTIKINNWIGNLEWCTGSENVQHAIKCGVFGMLAKNNPNSTISDEQVHLVCKCWDNGMTDKEIQKYTSLTLSAIRNIVGGATRKDITSQYILSKRLSHPFTNDQMHLICKYFENNKNHSGKQIDIIKRAIDYAGLEINSKTISAARHLYNRDTHDDITRLYIY